MSFVAIANPPPTTAEPPITQDGWWPDIDPAQARQACLLDGTTTAPRLRQALLNTTVQDFDITGSRPILLWLPAAAPARAEWLSQLVQAGIPVASLSPVRERLQDRYARTAQARDFDNKEPA